MTQRETILSMLRAGGPVTLADLFEAGVAYTGRNRIADLRREGYDIRFARGPRPSQNTYTLVSEPKPLDAIAPICENPEVEKASANVQPEFFNL